MEVAIVALLCVFGMPVAIVGIRQYFKHRNLLLEREAGVAPEERQRLAVLEKERALLEQRVQNLETIVCSVDLELNTRLNRLAAQQSQLALPAPAAASGAEAASSGQLATGTALGRFRVQQLIGRGAMGAVYLASDPQIGEPVALKNTTDARSSVRYRHRPRHAHRPRSSAIVAGARAGTRSGMRSGIIGIVFRFSVISSPTSPSPRVAPRVKRPSK